MNKIIKISIALGLCIFFITTFSKKIENCPSPDSLFALTQNKNGNSAYSNSVLLERFKIFIKSFHISLNNPILDIGSGYGEAPFELIKLGAKNIYVNDLDSMNIKCIKNNIPSVYEKNKIKIKYISGDITNDSISSQLPDNFFGFIHAKNVIHFFTYNQLISLIKILNQKSIKGGHVIIGFENPYIDKLNLLAKSLYGAHEKFPSFSMNEIVEQGYSAFSFDGIRHCSSAAYHAAPVGMKLPGFPCEIPSSSTTGQLLSPEIISDLMFAGGFEMIYAHSELDHERTQTLIFIKKENLSSNEIDEKIKTVLSQENASANKKNKN